MIMAREDHKQEVDYLVERWADESEMIKNLNLQNLHIHGKLCLVLDLDNTLIHTTGVVKFSQYHQGGGDVYRWKSMGDKYLTKLRPFVRQFLKEASQMFELYVYTMGTREYALQIVKFLDPKGVYFGSRIIAREDCTIKGQKGLDVVPVRESGVLILDDTKSVWKTNPDNLILIKKYTYFPTTERDESECEGELSYALSVLTTLHSVYFEWYNLYREGDVRELMQIYREDVVDEEGQQQVGTGTCSSDLGFGKRSRDDDDCPSQAVAKKQRICLTLEV